MTGRLPIPLTIPGGKGEPWGRGLGRLPPNRAEKSSAPPGLGGITLENPLALALNSKLKS